MQTYEPDADAQHAQWERTYANRPDFFGESPSEPARAALERFKAAGARHLLELGAGQGRDTQLFLGAGLRVTALDYAEDGLEQLASKSARNWSGRRHQPDGR